MTKEEWQIVDGVLKDFPKINRDKVLLEEYLYSLIVAVPGCDEFRKGVSRALFGQDRFLDMTEDKELKRLRRIISSVYKGYRELPNTERRLVSLWCFAPTNGLEDTLRTLHISKRQAYRLRASAYDKMLSYCTEVHEDVKRWRASTAKEIANFLMPLLQHARARKTIKKVGTAVT